MKSEEVEVIKCFIDDKQRRIDELETRITELRNNEEPFALIAATSFQIAEAGYSHAVVTPIVANLQSASNSNATDISNAEAEQRFLKVLIIELTKRLEFVNFRG